MYFNFLLLFKWASLSLGSDSQLWLMLFPGWHITDMVLWAYTSSFVVQGNIPLDFDDITLQKLLFVQLMVGSY